MKLVVQRVSRAEVTIGNKSVGKIGKGLFILIGVGKGDTEKDAETLAEKVAKLRIMSDPSTSSGQVPGKMNLNISDAKGKILAVSQFTLHANTKKGNRPSFIEAGDPKLAKHLYNHFVKHLRGLNIEVETGEFGAYMIINTVLDGPVTILLSS